MLSSQLTSTTLTTISPLLLQASISSSATMLRSTGSVSRRPRQCHQTRGFRFGFWSSYLDREHEREIQRRHRAVIHKYTKLINRKLEWDRKHPLFARQAGKTFMCSAWRGADPRGGRWVSMDEVKSMKDEAKPTNIEEKESYIDNYRRMIQNMVDRKLPMHYIRANAFYSEVTSSTPEPDSFPTRTYRNDNLDKASAKKQNVEKSEPEYEFDPITNRKVPKRPSDSPKIPETDTMMPVKTFKGYRSQFKTPSPPNSSLTPSEAELENYKQPFMHNEPDGKTQEKPDQVKQGLDEYDSASKGYGPVRFREPDGKLPENPDSVQESLKEYDESASYDKPFRHLEPDGKLPEAPDPVQESLKEYDESASYDGPFRHLEPDGKSPEKPDPTKEALKDYEDKIAPKMQASREGYGPIKFNEPHGQLPLERDTVAESLKEYDSRAIYGPSRTTKTSSRSKQSSTYPLNVDTTEEDLDLLRASDIRASSGILRKPVKETDAEKLAKRRELEIEFEKSQKIAASYAEEAAAAQKSKESGKVSKGSSTETDTTTGIVQIAGGKGGILNFRVPSENVERIRTELKSASREVTGNFVHDFPEESQVTWTPTKDNPNLLMPKSSDVDNWGYDKSPKGLEVSYEKEVESKVQEAEKQYIEGLASQDAFSRRPSTPRIETSLERAIKNTTQKKVTKPEILAQAEIDPYSKVPQGMETGYADECARQGASDLSVFVSSYGSPKLKPSRQIKLLKPDPEETAAEKKGVSESSSANNSGKANKEKEEAKKLVREVRSIYEDTYGTITSEHRQVPESREAKEQTREVTSEPEPTLYKILAYDPTMQAIDIAETTSVVNDTASPLTPAEVLLRLSNPAKFFPHFGPLQAQGYEIVSGSGDVLVFRKVRVAALPKVESSSIRSPRKSINPIDGMQSSLTPATGNFASPTGFVNHDFPVSDPPFKSNIDVRREEPVFSGRSSWQEDNGKSKGKKKGTLKRVFFAGTWLAGCSYAAGVVFDYFRTGGSDGKGPIGF